MKEKTFVEVESSNLLDLDSLYEQYALYTKMESDLRKKKKELKVQLEQYFETESTEDELGNFWLKTSQGKFKREVRNKLELEPMYADPILKRLNLYDKVVSYEPVYDLDMIKNYIADGSISDEEVSKMFKKEVSYALRVEQKKEEETEIS